MVLIRMEFVKHTEKEKSFRPLTGIMVLICKLQLFLIYPPYLVSVPLRGLWFLSSPKVIPMLRDLLASFRPLTGIMVLISYMIAPDMHNLPQFPSPYGDYGSYLAHGGSRVYELTTGFPSPYGDYGSYQAIAKAEDKSVGQVSVPLRGLWFLSAPFIDGFMKPLKWHFAGRIIYFHHFSSFTRK